MIDEHPEQIPDPRTIFVVHGRNDSLRRSMFGFLRAIGLRPLEWSTALALTGSASPYIGDVLDAAFARAQAVVVLLTPDEFAYLREDLGYPNEPDTKPQLQARPNVLFEAGMALGSHAKNTVLVEIGKMRPFTDVAGRHVVRLTNDIAVRQELANRLRTAGCHVDLTGTDWHTAGDFTPPSLPSADVKPASAPEPKKVREAREDLRFGWKIESLNNYMRPTIRAGIMRVTNQGKEDFLDVEMVFPNESSLEFVGQEQSRRVTIPVVPGGQSVTVRVERDLDMEKVEETAFYMSISARRRDGEEVSGSVFIDVNREP